MNDSDKEFLKEFFDFNIEWIIKHDLNEIHNIEKIKARLANFMIVNNLQDNITFKIFMHDIEYELLLLKEDSLDSNLKKNKKSSGPIMYINNHTINKWYLMTMIAYEVDKNELSELNITLDPKVKQKQYIKKDRFKI